MNSGVRAATERRSTRTREKVILALSPGAVVMALHGHDGSNAREACGTVVHSSVRARVWARRRAGGSAGMGVESGLECASFGLTQWMFFGRLRG